MNKIKIIPFWKKSFLSFGKHMYTHPIAIFISHKTKWPTSRSLHRKIQAIQQPRPHRIFLLWQKSEILKLPLGRSWQYRYSQICWHVKGFHYCYCASISIQIFFNRSFNFFGELLIWHEDRKCLSEWSEVSTGQSIYLFGKIS